MSDDDAKINSFRRVANAAAKTPAVVNATRPALPADVENFPENADLKQVTQ